MKRALPVMVLLVSAACSHGRVYEPAAVEESGVKFRITGPYAYENLAVYVLHSDARDDRDFMTLDEGLKDGTVTVTEKGEGQVGELLLENSSSKALFIQEGDRVKGGKQDRIVGLSFVVPAKSGKVAVPSFCIEQGRWSPATRGGYDIGGVGFTDVINRPLASKEIREAAKVQKDQGAVWDGVARGIRRAEEQLDITNRGTNLNDTLDSAKVVEAVAPFRRILADLVERHSDAVGVAFALNGNVEEINIYPGRQLLAKLYPKLLESYAFSATLEKKGGHAPAAADVASMMKEGREKGKRSEQVAGNCITVRDFEANIQCVTEYQGQSVHAQWMRREPDSAPPPGQEGQRQQREEQNQAPRR